MKHVLLIAGPTASGKSALAMHLAARRNGVIINADAMQVYRELRILTARPSIADERSAAHRLYGHVAGSEPYSVAQWLRDVEIEIRAAWEAGVLPIVVGGTGLYFKALEQGLADLPPIPDEIRQRWREFPGDLAEELRRRDPASAASLKQRDRQRLTRALEVIDATGKPLRHWQRVAQSQSVLAGVETEKLFLSVSRETLYGRAEARFDRMLESGALEEVRPVTGYNPDLPMMRAIGVKELRGYLLGESSLVEATEAAKIATRHYIKRQLTWWRNQMPDWTAVDAANSST